MTKIDAAKVGVNPKMKAPKKLLAIETKQTTAQIIAAMAESSGLEKTVIRRVLDSMLHVIHRHVLPKGIGELTLPVLGMKIRRVKKAATKARVIQSPLTGGSLEIQAKPARMVLKVSALKKLRELPNQS